MAASASVSLAVSFILVISSSSPLATASVSYFWRQHWDSASALATSLRQFSRPAASSSRAQRAPSSSCSRFLYLPRSRPLSQEILFLLEAKSPRVRLALSTFLLMALRVSSIFLLPLQVGEDGLLLDVGFFHILAELVHLGLALLVELHLGSGCAAGLIKTLTQLVDLPSQVGPLPLRLGTSLTLGL